MINSPRTLRTFCFTIMTLMFAINYDNMQLFKYFKSYCVRWKLFVNTCKTKIIRFSNRRVKQKYDSN